MKDLGLLSEKTGIDVKTFEAALSFLKEESFDFSIADHCLATTREGARDEFLSAAFDSVEEKAAFAKWLKFCTTIKEVQEAYILVPMKSAFEKAALQRIYELF